MLPGFSASSSLYRSRQAYRSSGASSTLDFAQMSGVDAPVYFAFIWPTSGVTCNSPCRIEEGQCICPPRCPTGSILNKFSNECECTPCASNQRQAGSATSKAGCFCAPCPSGQIGCNTECVDSTSDSNNCGGCGIRCPTGSMCRGGSCLCQDGDSPCGNICCDELYDCCNGRCIPQTYQCCGDNACSPSQICCSGTTCVNYLTDPNNCGTCGNQCASGALCQNGVCDCPTGESVSGLPPGLPLCSTLEATGGTGFCGTYENMCCLRGHVNCGGLICANLSSDSNNCGGCSHMCQGGQICDAGICSCPAGQSFTNGNCVPESTGGCETTLCNGICCPAQTRYCVNHKCSSCPASSPYQCEIGVCCNLPWNCLCDAQGENCQCCANGICSDPASGDYCANPQGQC
jgi:hypothetical protein